MTATNATDSQAAGHGPVEPRRHHPPEPPPLLRAGHRDHLDGLRAVAVYLVVLFHAGVKRFSGGFIGVDVFFVLSGYLVTQVLLRDVADHGRVRFGRFYSRRVRRLLPASVIALVVTATMYHAVATPAQVVDATNGFKAAFLYVTNWFLIGRSTGYFASDSASSPILHYWSLAVEEQFYVVWPILLAVLVWATARLRRHQWNGLRLLILLGAGLSAFTAFSLRASQPDRAYFGTDTRAYQLLAGAFLALTPEIVRLAARLRRSAQVVGIVGLGATVGLATNAIPSSPITRGIGITMVVAALIVALEADAGGLACRVLSTPPVTYLGRVSYGTYLWHWPVIVIIGLVHPVAPLPLAALAGVVGTGLASLSYQLVEMPVRRAAPLDRWRWPVAMSGLAISVVGAFLVIPQLTTTGPPRPSGQAEAQVGGFRPIPASFNQAEVYYGKFGETVDCVDRSPTDCTVVSGRGSKVLLMGDSNAEMWIPAFTRMAKDHDLTLSLAVTAGCLWQRDAYKLTPAIIAACKRTKTDAYERVIPALRPDLIVVVNAREPQGPLNPNYTSTPFNAVLRRSTPASIADLSKFTRNILIIEPAPTPTDEHFNPLDCLAKARVVEACRFVSTTKPSWLEVQERDIAARSPQVRTADFDRLICPFLPICDPMIGDTTVFWNGEHITTRYSRSQAPAVWQYLKDQHLVRS